jgi:hypothetical protein
MAGQLPKALHNNHRMANFFGFFDGKKMQKNLRIGMPPIFRSKKITGGRIVASSRPAQKRTFSSFFYSPSEPS